MYNGVCSCEFSGTNLLSRWRNLVMVEVISVRLDPTKHLSICLRPAWLTSVTFKHILKYFQWIQVN